MGSKWRIPLPHMRRPPPGLSMIHPDSYGPSIPPPTQGTYPPFNILPSPEIMEQKLATQQVEMQRLATENERLAATHGTLRQELAAAQHELQMLHAQIGAMKFDRQQRMMGLADKVAKMEAELQTAAAVQLDLQQARADAQTLVVARDELMSIVHQLTQDLQKARLDVQKIPALISELENLRQEYQHCRGTYDYEKKFYSDHLESLQAMEKNYMTMAREVEKLQAQLVNTSIADRRAGGSYGSTTGNNENEVSGYQAGQNVYEVVYGVHKGHIPLPGGNAAEAPTAYGGPQQGYISTRAGYDITRGPPGYDPSREPTYDPQIGGLGYDLTVRVASGPHGGQFAPGPRNNPAYGSAATPPTRAYEAQQHGGNLVRR